MGTSDLKHCVLLAAGYGNRLKPITQNRPKPLIRFFGIPLLDYHLYRISQAQVPHLSMNCSYLGGQIKTYCDQQEFYTSIEIHNEPDPPLGTGGVFVPMRSTIESYGHTLVVNSDIIANIDFIDMFKVHQDSGNLLTMALLSYPNPGETAIYVQDHRVLGITKQPADTHQTSTHGFACAYVFDAEFYMYLAHSGPRFEIMERIQNAIDQNEKIGAYIHDGYWFDVGTPMRLYQAHQHFFDLNSQKEIDKLLSHGQIMSKTGRSGIFYLQNDSSHHDVWRGPLFLAGDPKKYNGLKIGPYTIFNEPPANVRKNHISHSLLSQKPVLSRQRIDKCLVIGDYTGSLYV